MAAISWQSALNQLRKYIREELFIAYSNMHAAIDENLVGEPEFQDSIRVLAFSRLERRAADRRRDILLSVARKVNELAEFPPASWDSLSEPQKVDFLTNLKCQVAPIIAQISAADYGLQV